MKMMKQILAFALALLMVCALTACGGGGSKSVAGTYTVTMDAEECANNLVHNGYLAASVPTEVNTLVLNDDNTYTYTTHITTEKNGVELKYVFTGTYTNTDAEVTLEAPTDCEFSEVWGAFTDYGFLNSSGKHSEGAVVQCKAESGHKPLEMFLTPYLIDSDETGDVKVTLDADNATCTYSSVASSDDD